MLSSRLVCAGATLLSPRSLCDRGALTDVVYAMGQSSVRVRTYRIPGTPPPQSLSDEQRYQARGPNISFRIDSANIVGDPYKGPRPWLSPLAFFHPKGWRDIRTRVEDFIKNVYCIRTCQNHLDDFKFFSFKRDAVDIYTRLSRAVAVGDKKTIGKLATSKVAGEIKKDIRIRKAHGCRRIHWSLDSSDKKIKLIRGRVLGVPDNKHSPSFAQCTFLFKNKQKFVAYDDKGRCIAGSEEKAYDVEDYWVFERLLRKADPSSRWRVAARLVLSKN